MKLLELERPPLLPISVSSLNWVIEGSLPGEDLLSVSIEQLQHLLCFIRTPHLFSVLYACWHILGVCQPAKKEAGIDRKIVQKTQEDFMSNTSCVPEEITC